VRAADEGCQWPEGKRERLFNALLGACCGRAGPVSSSCSLNRWTPGNRSSPRTGIRDSSVRRARRGRRQGRERRDAGKQLAAERRRAPALPSRNAMSAGAVRARRVAAAALATLGVLALCWAALGRGAGGAGAGVLEEEEREPGARGRRVLNRVAGSELSHSSDQSFHAWHQGACLLACARCGAVLRVRAHASSVRSRVGCALAAAAAEGPRAPMPLVRSSSRPARGQAGLPGRGRGRNPRRQSALLGHARGAAE